MPMSRPVSTKRATSIVSTAKPHSGAPYGPSAENQNNATLDRKSSFSDHGFDDATYAGRRLSHGLNMKNVHGARKMDRTSGGSSTSSATTPAATSTTVPTRARTARATPRITVPTITRTLPSPPTL